MKVLVTGAAGFIGKNLCVRLSELGHSILPFGRVDSPDQLPELVNMADAVVHLAGENRPKERDDFNKVNSGLTRMLCDAVRASGKSVPLLLASSTQIEKDSPYGLSKLAAEKAVRLLARDTKNPVVIYRLPNVFGKWCRPNYNSVVATFCHNIANDLPIQISDPNTSLTLVHIDDVIESFVQSLQAKEGAQFCKIKPEYQITLGELAEQISAFKCCRENLIIEKVGAGLNRALYSTYVSYLDTQDFSYSVTSHADDRGVFVEMLKTKESGQFSFFTAKPGITRGEHYHHTKTEKFLVIKGKARFGFRHIITDEKFQLTVSGDEPMVVDTVPGWTHDITNIGVDEMVVMLWANEIFDPEKPDTMVAKV